MDAEERQDCQAFMEAFGVGIWACLPENQGTLLYPLQLLTSNVPLATLLGMSATTQLWVVAEGGLVPTSSIPSMSEMPVPLMGAKCWYCSSDQGVAILRQEEEEAVDIDDIPEEHPHCKWKEGRPAVKTLKEPCQEAFSNELEVVKVARQAYYKAHWPNFKQEGLYDLSSTFWQLAISTNLLGTKIHEVQEDWSGQQELRATNKAAKASQRDIYFFRVVAPTESPKIMGLKGIHSPEALQRWSGLSFCPWCGKEGQNEGTVVNHLWMMHYHMGLMCTHCVDYFMTSTDAMCWHTHICKSTTSGNGDNDRKEEDYEDDDNVDEDDEFMFKKF